MPLNRNLRIGVDLMGGDNPPSLLFQAILKGLEQFSPAVSFVVFAIPSVIEQLRSQSLSYERNGSLAFISVSDFIAMSDSPLHAIRRKKDSSLVVGVKLLRQKKLDAFVSPGNTGALVACAKLSLPMFPGIDRPALLTTLPTKKKPVAVLDVGGTVSYKSHHLIQFAQMGSAYQRCIAGIEKPKVGLLNIGVESKKGTVEHAQAYEALQGLENSLGITFVGNIEGRAVFEGDIDLLVTDGFTGNIFLKATEGASSFILKFLEDHFISNPEQIHAIQQQLNYEEFPGALVMGVQGIIMKCHGSSTSRAMYHSIARAIKLAEQKIIEKLVGDND